MILGIIAIIIRSLAVRCDWHWFWTCYLGWISIPFIMSSVWRFIPGDKWHFSIVSCAFPLYLVHPFARYALEVYTGYPESFNVFSGFICLISCSFVLIMLVRLMGMPVCRILFGGR